MNDCINDQAGLDQAMVQAAMNIAAAGDWTSCRLVDIAAAAGLNPGTLPAHYRNKTDVLRALADKLDAEVLAAVDGNAKDPNIPVRERLLEVLMQRFDAMAPCKAGITGVLRTIPLSPSTMRHGFLALARSMKATLDMVNIPSGGISGAFRAKGLAVAFLDGLRVWISDDSPDLSATMRRLDERLKQAEGVAISLGLAQPEKTL
ncbi:MAG: TetR/AcrR family transcriptional regulator [Alphaproteobacteria bacterium]|jgi:AcrR family transcriptional regulator